MTSWQNGALMKWQVAKMASFKFTQALNYEITTSQNDTKFASKETTCFI
jgi:hypothetical protein